MLNGYTQISVVMATFNGGAFIKEQLESLLQQTLPPYELIVCDDGSTDGTLAVVEKFASISPFPVYVFRNDSRLGYRRNFIKAASLSSGTLIGFCDQDDVWHNKKLEICAAGFEPGTLLLQHNALVCAQDGDLGLLKTPPLPPRNASLTIDPWWTAYGLTMIFSHELLDYWDLWETSICAHVSESEMEAQIPESHDHWVLFLASSLGTTVYIDQPLVRYRQHAANAEGWGGTMPLGRKLRHILERRDKVYLNCYRSAKRREEILATIALRKDSKTARNASQAYGELAEFYAFRHALYSGNSFGARFRAFSALCRHHVYGDRNHWTWGLKGALKDAILAVIFGSVLRVHGWSPSGSDPTCRATGR